MGQNSLSNLVLILGTVTLPMLTIVTSQYPYAADLVGDFCRKGGVSRCCDGRIDTCAVPILGTLCYCDQFCDRTVNPDCCPDYWDVCRERKPTVPPPVPLPDYRCFYKGGVILHLTSKKYNCNTCTCNFGKLSCEEDACLIDEDLLNYIEGNGISLGWSSKNYSSMWGKKLDEGLTKMTGTLPPDGRTLRMHPIRLHYDRNQIPREFDVRRRWPNLSGIRDQGWCGSSWAFSTITVAQDRLIIASNGTEVIDWSTQNLISCDKKGQHGCNGGYVERAWGFLRKIGVVAEDCYPYVNGDGGPKEQCKLQNPRQASLKSLQCSRKQFPMGRTELYTTEPAYRISSDESDIMWELYTNGPVQALMKVYRDFFLYSDGIYSRTSVSSNSDNKFATHSVRLLGWGEETNYYGTAVKYWLVANSWGTSWGREGTFKIRRGTNESDIEQFILAVRSRLSEEANLITRRRNRFSRNRSRN